MKALEQQITMLLLTLAQILRRGWERLWPKLKEDRGDVPGWVMITLVTMPSLLLAPD